MAAAEDQIAACRRAERRATIRIVLGACNVPFVVGLFFLDRALWEVVSILYLALVSIVPLIEGPYSSRASKRAERRALEETPSS